MKNLFVQTLTGTLAAWVTGMGFVLRNAFIAEPRDFDNIVGFDGVYVVVASELEHGGLL